ncbi:DUF2087 domain-containing protein [Bacillus horti]|uniref:DUF2087 domain-containing protein n=1 Tax=Caldalkalibacillus horti TaxID=77523 RepID=A0ABT9W3W9_9BACI|nr:DUF2087 domain-containing protein [Bacillus horti]MDQ0167943.1 hypothetical protein [Bacillus horti]
MNSLQLIWDASLEELKTGYRYDHNAENYTCLICGQQFTKGIVYEEDGVFYEAEKFTRLHIVNEHTSVFHYLLSLDKKYTGLTDKQKKVVQLYQEGLNDNEIMKETGAGSASTIRNYRFLLREGMKASKIYLAIMELAEEKARPEDKFISTHRTPNMYDQRYAITEQENEKILSTYFPDGLDGPLAEFPKKQKRKLAILLHIVKRFEANRPYTEKEINDILKNVYDDYVVLRRYLIDYGFLGRQDDGSTYWIRSN